LWGIATKATAPVTAGQEWDAIAVVNYPSRQAFAEMIRDPEYQAAAHLRSEALLEATLQPTEPMIG
jgi:uncharacterized protein (DUF1330 family)